MAASWPGRALRGVVECGVLIAHKVFMKMTVFSGIGHGWESFPPNTKKSAGAPQTALKMLPSEVIWGGWLDMLLSPTHKGVFTGDNFLIIIPGAWALNSPVVSSLIPSASLIYSPGITMDMG
jgi:hypothetical protein